MPSFYRTAQDVRLVFGADAPQNPEEERQRDRLMTIFRQTLRRSGARGSFFFHRSSRSLGGRPILLLEPQGPIDQGIFQEGLTRFGETLSGTFTTPQSGHLILEAREEVSEANLLKYARDIRRLIADMVGVMASGGDDRVQISTPRQRAEAAHRAAQQAAAGSSAASAEGTGEGEEGGGGEADPARLAHVLEQASPVAEPSVGAREQATQQVAAALQQEVPRWQEEARALQVLEARLLAARVDIDSLEAAESRLHALTEHLGPVRSDEALGRILADIEDDPVLSSVAEERSMSGVWSAVRSQQRALQEKRAALQPQIAETRGLQQQHRQNQERLERERREALRALAETARARIRHHGGADAEGRAMLDVVTRLERAEEALHWIAVGVARIGGGGGEGALLSGEALLGAAAQQDPMVRQAVAQLTQEAAALRGLGALELLPALWSGRVELAGVAGVLGERAGVPRG